MEKIEARLIEVLRKLRGGLKQVEIVSDDFSVKGYWMGKDIRIDIYLESPRQES